MILITGGTGFVGRNLISKLLTQNRKIRLLARDPQKAASFLKAGCETSAGDIKDRQSILNAITPEVDTVIHLVGILVETRTAKFREIHTEGTRNVVEACALKGVRRYIHISALGTRKGARSIYHRTKWEAEEIVRGSNLDYTIFRPSVLFGREDQFTNVFARIMKKSPVVMIPGNGQNRMQPLFIKDLVEAMSASIDMPPAKKAVYEAGGPQILTFDEIIDKIMVVLGEKRLKLHIPMPIMRANAAIIEAVFSKPIITRDALLMVEEDNITSNNALTSVFGIKLTGFTDGMRTYL